MIAVPEALIPPAKAANITVPEDIENFDADDFPHWQVYRAAQLGRPMPSPSSHWNNAEIIARISDDKIKTITPDELVKLGFEE